MVQGLLILEQYSHRKDVGEETCSSFAQSRISVCFRRKSTTSADRVPEALRSTQAARADDPLRRDDALSYPVLSCFNKPASRLCPTDKDVLQLFKSGTSAIGRVGRAPSQAATSNRLLMN